MTKSPKSQDDSFLDCAVPLDSILFTGELRRRPSRPPDYEKENRALVALARALADSADPIFQTLAETTQDITQCDSAGLSLLTKDGKTPDASGERFYWPAIAGMWKPYIGGGTPRDFSPCGNVLDRNCTLLFKHFERRYTYLLRFTPSVEECLLVPFYVGGKAVGTIWAIMHRDLRKFDAEDERLMSALVQFASLAYQTVASMRDLKLQMAAREKAEAAVRELGNGSETQVRVRTQDLDRSTRDLLHTNEALEREIAERKSAEEPLPVRELNLRLLAESIPAPVAVMTPSGEVETVNKPNLEYFGKTLEDLKKWVTSDAVHPDDLPHAIEIWMEALHTGQPYHIKQRLRRFDGVYRWFEVRGFPLRDPDGRILNWCVLLTDIHDRQRAEEALRLSEAHLSQGQRLAHVGSWVWQVAGRKTVYLSEEWYRVYGFDPSLGMPTWEERLHRVHPEDRAKWQATIDRAIDEKSDYDLEVRILPPRAAVRYVHSVGRPVFGSSGELVQFAGVSMDVTQSRQAEQAFRLLVVGTAATTGSDFFQSLVQHMAQALRARYAFVSTCDDQRHARTLAFWKGDGFGENFEFDVADTPCEKVLHGEVCHYRKELQGLFPRDNLLPDWQAESYLGVPMLDRSHRVIGHLAILDDRPMEADSRSVDLLKIFASRAAAELKRQRVEEELQAALQERERMREELAHLAHLNRVSTMGELAASLAHEIKQPIAAAMTDARTCSRWLTRDRPDLPEAQAAASRVVKDVTRASEIIARVRSLFKKDSLQHEEVDINELIQEMIALLRGEASRHSILIQSDFSLDLPPIMADRVQLQQVLMNLMLNSIEAMKSMNTPGKLTIKSQQVDSGQLLISVMDTGVGVPPEKIDQVFNAFFTSKPQGTGMGLAISRSIIESHGGRLWATPNTGSGATFHFTLPTRRNAHHAAAVPLPITLESEMT